MRRLAVALLALLLVQPPTLLSTPPAQASAPAEALIVNDPMGRMRDVTHQWRRYQPANVFCIRPEVFELSGDSGADASGKQRACRRSGFRRKAENLYRVKVTAPPLCPGCRRLFIDFSTIPEQSPPRERHARGHAYFRILSANPGYTIDARGHSPNTKNVTNDKLVVPAGSPWEPAAAGMDAHAMSYVADTLNFAHSAIQGPYYIGPWYLNRNGKRIHGLYVDVDVAGAEPLPGMDANALRYGAAFNSGEPTCPDNNVEGYEDGNYFYGGCFDHVGMSSEPVYPRSP